MIYRAALHRRLQASVLVPITPSVRADHLAAIELALASAPAVPERRGARLSRRVVFVVAVSLVSVLSVGTVLAAEGAVPGDLLYPVKRVTESVRSVFDSDVTARHRVDELRVLLERDAVHPEIDLRIADARAAVDRLPSDHFLHDRLTDLEAVRDAPIEVGVPDQPVRVTDEPATDGEIDVPSVDVRPVPDFPVDVLRDGGHADRLELYERYRHRIEALRDRLGSFLIGHPVPRPSIDYIPESPLDEVVEVPVVEPPPVTVTLLPDEPPPEDDATRDPVRDDPLPSNDQPPEEDQHLEGDQPPPAGD